MPWGIQAEAKWPFGRDTEERIQALGIWLDYILNQAPANPEIS